MKYLRFFSLLIFCLTIIWCQSPSTSPSTDQTNTWPNTIDTSRPQTIYALGDSLTAGYQLPIQDSYPAQLQNILAQQGYDINVVNGWHSGDTSAQLLERISRSIADAQPQDIMLLVIGANDGLQWLSLVNLEQHIRDIIEIWQKKDLTIILWGMQLPLNQGAEYRQTFTSLYPRLASEYNIALIPFFLEGVAGVPSLNLPDGIHPTKEWYTIIATNIANFLTTNILPSP